MMEENGDDDAQKKTSMWQFTALSAFAYGAIGDMHTLVKIDDVFVTENQFDWLNAYDDKDLIRKNRNWFNLHAGAALDSNTMLQLINTHKC